MESSPSSPIMDIWIIQPFAVCDRASCKVLMKFMFLNLHGNSKKKERSPDGTKDENVFDISQVWLLAFL